MHRNKERKLCRESAFTATDENIFAYLPSQRIRKSKQTKTHNPNNVAGGVRDLNIVVIVKCICVTDI